MEEVGGAGGGAEHGRWAGLSVEEVGGAVGGAERGRWAGLWVGLSMEWWAGPGQAERHGKTSRCHHLRVPELADTLKPFEGGVTAAYCVVQAH